MISFRRLKGMSPEQEALSWRTVFGGDRVKGRASTPQEALKISAFYRAVDIRSDSIGKYPVSVKNMATRQEVPNHYLGKVLWDRPNEAMSPFSYRKLVEYQRLVLGNAYVWISRDGAGRPVELIPLPPGTCETYIDPDTGNLWYLAVNPKTKEPYRLNPADVLHYKGFSVNGIDGMSVLSYAANTLTVAAARDAYESSVYENGGRPSGILYTDTDLSNAGRRAPNGDTQMGLKDRIRQEWDRVHSGPNNAFRIAVLDNGLKYQAISMSNSDQQFVENKAVTVEDIARFTGVPLHKLYTGKQSYESNEANSLDYVKDTMHPAVCQYEQEDSYKLLTASERAKNLWLPRNMMAELRADFSTRADWYKAMRQMGVYSVNDILRKEDEPDVVGGDSRYASLNYVPLEHFDEISMARNVKERGDEQI